MSDNFERLKSVVEDTADDVAKAESGNKAATSRVRKQMQAIKAVAQDIRKEMLELRDSGGS
ncbi:MAG TPA: histone H1 [Planctomycetota bacterium]|nr:histone H1 [Planctomycetota bacterium]